MMRSSIPAKRFVQARVLVSCPTYNAALYVQRPLPTLPVIKTLEMQSEVSSDMEQ